MKINIDGKEILNISETHKKVIQNEIPTEIFQEDIERRVAYFPQHKYEQCMKRLKKEWLEDKDGNGQSKLSRNGVNSVPVDDDALAELIFSQPDYRNRTYREIDIKLTEIKEWAPDRQNSELAKLSSKTQVPEGELRARLATL